MSAPFTIAEDRPNPKGGQVPLLKHAVMAWLQKNRADNGRIHGDTYNIAADTRAAVPNVLRACWDLQKQGLITFRERKNAGTNGHGATTVLNHFELTSKGIEWTPDRAVIADLTDISTNTWDDLNPDYVAESAVDDVAEAMKDEASVAALDRVREALSPLPPVVALERVLRMRGKPMHIIHELNPLLGYHAKSTAIYSLVRQNPEAFHIKDARVHLDAPEGWQPRYDVTVKSGRARHPVLAEAQASVALDGETQVASSVSDDAQPQRPQLQLPELGPEITALMAREVKRAKVQEAVAALEAAGLDDDALTVLGRIPDDSALEREVIALVKELRNE